jgi:hypothetical protein
MSRNNKNSETKKSGNRSERLALALRENLRRRKAQERGRNPPPARDVPKERSSDPHNGQPC